MTDRRGGGPAAGGRGRQLPPGSVRLAGLAGLGTAPFGSGPGWELDWGPSREPEPVAAIRAAVAAGVGWIDTAPFYGWGRAERAVGLALGGTDLAGTIPDGGAPDWLAPGSVPPDGPAGGPDRDGPERAEPGVTPEGAAAGPVLLTKCGTLRGPDGKSYEDHSAGAIRADLRASLARLGRLTVDVLQLHDPDPHTPVESAWATIHELVAAGKARSGGLSNHPVVLMDRALTVGPVAVVQHQYSLLHRAPEREGVLAWCAEHGAEFLAWSPLASGFLADGFDVILLSAGDFRRGLPWASGDLGERLAIVRRGLAGISADAGLSMAALSVGWVLSKGAKAIVGARTPAEAAAIAAYRPLAPDVAAAVEEAARPFGG